MTISALAAVFAASFTAGNSEIVAPQKPNAAVAFAAKEVAATGVTAEYGLLLTNATVSAEAGKYNVRFAGSDTDAWINILTVPAAADPGLALATVSFWNASGREAKGDIRREEIVIGDVPCVRYAACRKSKGFSVVFR